jgi:hypothetical protein
MTASDRRRGKTIPGRAIRQMAVICLTARE